MGTPSEPTAPTPPELVGTHPELARIQDYVWTRYVEYRQPKHPLDEAGALAALESHHGSHGMQTDAECFYYGILAFERSFAEPERSKALLERALTAFRAYRRQTSQGFVWEAVEDRYHETLERLGLAKASAAGQDPPSEQTPTAPESGASQ